MGLREGAPGPGQLTPAPARRRRGRVTAEELAQQEAEAEGHLDQLEARLGLKFKDRGLLREAMTHTSWINERGLSGRDNERLEYLGDAVLELVAGEYLFRRFPAYDEGQLTQIRSSLVSTVALARLGEELRLGEVLRLGRGAAKSGARRLTSLHANAFEALVGATFLDQGYRRAGRIFISRIGDLSAWTDPNFKGRLQAVAQEKLGAPPQYRTAPEGGDPRSRHYLSQVTVEGHGFLGEGRGGTKQAAEQAAARAALDKLMAPVSKKRRRRSGVTAPGLSDGAPFAAPAAESGVVAPAAEAPPTTGGRRRRRSRAQDGEQLRGATPTIDLAVAVIPPESGADESTGGGRRRRRGRGKPAATGPAPAAEVVAEVKVSEPAAEPGSARRRRRRTRVRAGPVEPGGASNPTASDPVAPPALPTAPRRRRRRPAQVPAGDTSLPGETQANPGGEAEPAAPARRNRRGHRGGRRRSGVTSSGGE